ncbi:hypothetical protein C8R42DRAFT_588198 [Lentinula raphanica]|nr:hypothetical protein C8R42DRAFT_588198 [Lentinula raphanica]
MHDAYKVGTYWDQIPGYEQRANCQHCRVPETLEHILLECECPGQNEIWEAAGELWKKQKTNWIKPEYGTILGCGAVNIFGENKKAIPGESRLYRIVVSESAHLIWKLRNERIINLTDTPSKERIVKRWNTAIKGRHQIDYVLSSNKYGKRQLSKRAMYSTWKNVLGSETPNSDDNREGIGVLVGERARS